MRWQNRNFINFDGTTQCLVQIDNHRIYPFIKWINRYPFNMHRQWDKDIIKLKIESNGKKQRHMGYMYGGTNIEPTSQKHDRSMWLT